MTTRTPWTHLDPGPCTTMYFPATPAAPSMARKLLIEDLQRSDVRRSVVEDAEVVLAELVANAVEHGTPSVKGEIEVSWCLHDDQLLISVFDSGQTVTDLQALRMTDDALRGRGLAMVDYLCDSWDVETENGLRVTAELNFSGSSVEA